MHMSSESLLIILLVGLVAGWLAGQIVQGTGFGIVGDLVIGIIGAFIGSWLLPRLGIHLGVGIVAAIVNATIGALILLLIIKLVRGGGEVAGKLGKTLVAGRLVAPNELGAICEVDVETLSALKRGIAADSLASPISSASRTSKMRAHSRRRSWTPSANRFSCSTKSCA